MAELKKDKVEVIGVSFDTPASHRKFIAKYSLNFPLLADGEAREFPDRPGRQDRARDGHLKRRHAPERDEGSDREAQRTLTSDSARLQSVQEWDKTPS
jgi:hypothetical protein